MVPQRSKRSNAELAHVSQRDRHAFFGFLALYLDRFLPRPHLADATRQAEKRERAAVTLALSALQQHLGGDVGASGFVLIDRQFISDRALVLGLPIVNLEPHRLLDAPGTQTLETTTLL